MVRVQEQLFNTNTGNKKGGLGHEGNTSPTRTPEDEALARRRFEEYVRLTREMEPGSYDVEDVIKTLPMDGGTPLECGDTRFYHLTTEHCTNPSRGGDRCGRELRNGRTCDRQIGHNTQCWSREYRLRNQETSRKRRQRDAKRAKLDKRDGQADL